MSGSPHPPAERSTGDLSRAAFPATPTFTPTGVRAPSHPPVRQDHRRRAMQAPSIISHLELGPLDSSVTSARLHARRVMEEWKFDEDFIETAELLVSELTTNALFASRALQEPLPSPIHLWLKAGFRRVMITVWDGNRQPPVLAGDVALDAEHGRGLLIVDYFAQDWGWFEPPRIGGKCVWCEFVHQAAE
jgi:anti-sigma regulatory factor (Ser/Thr protein kinase)